MSDTPIAISITPDAGAIEAWDKASRGLVKPSEFNAALSRAINRALASTRTEAVKQAREQYTVQRGEIVKTIKTRSASATSLSAELRFTGGRIPLMKFVVKPKGGISFKGKPRQGRKKLFVQIRQDGGGETEGLFVAEIGREPGVYKRTTKKRFPVSAETGPSIVSMVGNEEAVAAIQGKADKILSERIDHEMRRMLSK